MLEWLVQCEHYGYTLNDAQVKLQHRGARLPGKNKNHACWAGPLSRGTYDLYTISERR